MNEHDDDLDSTVHEGAEGEADTFPDTSDELEELATDEIEEETEAETSDEEPDLDDDESEL